MGAAMTKKAAIWGVCLAAPLGWVVSASWLYLSFVGRRDLFVFPFTQWIDAAPYFAATAWMKVYVIGSAVIPTGILAMALIGSFQRGGVRRHLTTSRGNPARAAAIRPVERGGTDNHGHTDWRSLEDTKQRFPGPHPLWGGLVVGEAYRVDLDRSVRGIPFDPADKATWGLGGRAPLLIDPCTRGGHSAVFAGTGGYKTSEAVTKILHWTGSSVIFDPSMELGPMLDEPLRRQRKQVFHVGIPDPSLKIPMGGWNVLSWLDPTHPEADAHLRSQVSRIFDEDRAASARPEDPFFSTMGRSLVTCILADLVWSDPDKIEISLATFAAGMATPEDDMVHLLTQIHASSRSAMARRIAGSLMRARAAETFSSIYLSAVRGIEWLYSAAYADLVSVGPFFDPRALLLGNCTVFLHINLRTLESTPAIARCLIGSLLNSVFMANGYTRGWILFLIDEAYKAGRDPALETARDMGRHYKVVLHTLWQSVGQMHEVWGEDGMRAWLDAFSWVAYGAIRAAGAGGNLSRDLGGYGALAYSEGDNTGRQKPAGLSFGTFSRGQNLNVHEISHPLITAAQMQQDLREDEQIVVPASGMPIRAGRALYFRRDEIVAQIPNDTLAMMATSAAE